MFQSFESVLGTEAGAHKLLTEGVLISGFGNRVYRCGGGLCM